MESLTPGGLQALKAIADNLDFSQTASLTQLLVNRLHRMKVIKIKETLLEKFQTQEQLTKFIPLVEKIDNISVFGDELTIELSGEPRYQLIVDQNEGDVIPFMENTEMKHRKEKYFIMMESEDSYEHLVDFGWIFHTDSFLNQDYYKWANDIQQFLTTNDQISDLTLDDPE